MYHQNMQYIAEIGKKWGESGALFIAAFLSSFFLLFILIEPFLSSFYHLKEGLEGPTIQAHIRSEAQNPENASPNEPQKEVLTRQTSEKEGLLPPKTPTAIETSPSPPAINPVATPEIFAFNAAPNIESPSSAPILGGRSGLRSKAPSAPGPKKNRDSISDEALATYRNQTGQEVERRQAQVELAQVMSSLETNEEYSCSSKNSSGNVQCLPTTPKAAFLAWVIGRLYPNETCISVQASQMNGFKKQECSR